MIVAKITLKDLADVEYHGSDGVTSHCLDAIARLIHFGQRFYQVRLLSCVNDGFGSHALLLTMEYEHLIAIKAGFASGYGGEGPAGLSTALKLLEKHRAEIDEYDISSVMMERLNAGCLLRSDLEWLEGARSVRPQRFYDYILDRRHNEDLERYFPPTINFGLIDSRLMDVALVFFDNPSHAIDTSYKRLEDRLRHRTELAGESGSKLLTKAFVGDQSLLHWDDENGGEHNSKGNLFKSVFGAYRNPRAHREVDADDKEALREFMLINELYMLEAGAEQREQEQTEQA